VVELESERAYHTIERLFLGVIEVEVEIEQDIVRSLTRRLKILNHCRAQNGLTIAGYTMKLESITELRLPLCTPLAR
jgi:hypothetical protein